MVDLGIIFRYGKTENLEKLIKIQALVKKKKIRRGRRGIRLMNKYYKKKRLEQKFKERRINYTLSRQIDTNLVQTGMKTRIELEAIDK